jgi:sugar transferase (PEP-CTERM/EpsH1 system associated)
MSATVVDARPLIAHVLYRFDVGGLENGVVNLINRLPAHRFRHAVVALTEVSDFRQRIERDDVVFAALHKAPGHGIRVVPRMREVLQQLRPTVVHTRNLAALEMSLAAAWAGVPVRIHGEHGWDVNDPDGSSRKFSWVRRLYRPFVHHYVALSNHQAAYLADRVGVPAPRLTQIYNGVDLKRFHPAAGARTLIGQVPALGPSSWIVGAVGRLEPIKNQQLLARAFVRARELSPAARQHMRLVIAGDGPDAAAIDSVLHEGGATQAAWMAGKRSDVADVMRGLDCFVLPSRAEGISNTILEAMATALPIIATDVGGNRELLDDRTGQLVPSDDVDAMAVAMLADFSDPSAARARGRRALAAAQQRFDLQHMVGAYAALYERLIEAAPSHRHAAMAQHHIQ